MTESTQNIFQERLSLLQPMYDDALQDFAGTRGMETLEILFFRDLYYGQHNISRDEVVALHARTKTISESLKWVDLHKLASMAPPQLRETLTALKTSVERVNRELQEQIKPALRPHFSENLDQGDIPLDQCERLGFFFKLKQIAKKTGDAIDGVLNHLEMMPIAATVNSKIDFSAYEKNLAAANTMLSDLLRKYPSMGHNNLPSMFLAYALKNIKNVQARQGELQVALLHNNASAVQECLEDGAAPVVNINRTLACFKEWQLPGRPPYGPDFENEMAAIIAEVSPKVTKIANDLSMPLNILLQKQSMAIDKSPRLR